MFDRNTFMTLANFGEEQGARSMYLLLDRKHEQKSLFDKLFRVIDAKRVNS